MDKKEVYKFICVLWDFAKAHLDIPNSDEGWDKLVADSDAVVNNVTDEDDKMFVRHLLNAYLLYVHLKAKRGIKHGYE